MVIGLVLSPPLLALKINTKALEVKSPKVQQAISVPIVSVNTVSSNIMAAQNSNTTNEQIFAGGGGDLYTSDAPEEFYVDLGPPDLPAGTAQLRINGTHLDGHLFPTVAFQVSWDVSYLNQANGIVLMSSTNPDELVCTSDLENSPSLFGDGFYSASNGAGFSMFSPMFLPMWKDIYVAACVVETIGENQVSWLGGITNVVKVDYTEPPDLVVKDIYWESDGDIEFIVANEGFWKKRIGLIRYYIRLDTYNHLGEISNTQNFFGDAALTSLSVLQPGESTGWDRAVDHTILPNASQSVTVCINPGGVFTETNIENNCYTEFADTLLPDLALEEDSLLALSEPQEDDDGFWLWEPFKLFWEGITGGIEFDVSGIPSDKVTFTVTNTGQITLVRFGFLVAAYSDIDPLESGYEHRGILEATIEPGQSKTFNWYFEPNKTRFDNPEKVHGTLMIDPSGTLVETNEANNKLPISTIRLRD